MNSNNKWFKIIIYIMIASMLLSTFIFTIGFFFE